MKCTFTTPIIFSTIILLNFLSLHSLAQPVGMTMNQVYSQLSKQNMNMRMQQMTYMNFGQNAGKVEAYYVFFKDSTQGHVKSYMYYDTLRHKNFLIFVNKKFPKSDSSHRFQKIYPDQTESVDALVIDETNSEKKKSGLPTDSGWKFKALSGPITVYAKSASYFRITKTPFIGNPILDFEPSQIIGMQFNDGPIEKLTKETVSAIVASNTKAAELIETKGLYEAIKRYNKDAEKVAKN